MSDDGRGDEDPTDESDDGRGDEDPTDESDDGRGGDSLDDLEDVESDPLGDPDDDRFDEIDVGDVDESPVWEALGEQEDATTDGTAAGAPPDVDTDPDEEIVPKRSYCEKCDHFSAPPDTACTHPGTEILELVDMDHFKVVDCPVVARRRSVDDYDAD